MRIIFFVIALFVSFVAKAQDSILSLEQLQSQYIWASAEERTQMDLAFKETEDKFKAQQVTNIGGIEFGISYEEAKIKLEKKYGNPEYFPNNTALPYSKVKYAGYDFDSINFLFESDGVKSYLNACIFILNAKTKNDAIKKLETLHQLLSQKYELEEYPTDGGYKAYVCGFSPLWDGHWYTFKYDMSGAIHTDIIEYKENAIDLEGNRFAARLIYGPYSYVKEEF